MNLEYVNKVLAAGVKNGASDIHLKADRAPMYRIDGRLREVKAPKLTSADTLEIVRALLARHHASDDVDALNDLDTSYMLDGVGRFRVNIYRQRGSFAVILRIIALKIPTFADLKMPSVLEKISATKRGLILVTGVTGSGKSSTLAAIIDHINANRQEHILTLEDPIEFVHPDKQSSVSQREIGQDSRNFADALRAALRQDPDVILVGEMRDYETIDIALKAAETGHLVLSTVHTTDAVRTIGRLVGVFPPEQQEGARLRLAENLKATISQRLLPRADGQGRIAAAEIMLSNMGVDQAIRDPDRTGEIKDIIERGHLDTGSQSFDQHLTKLFRENLITLETARGAATNAADFERALNFE